MRPAAGVLGTVAYPIHGAWKSSQNPWAHKQESPQRSTRIRDGLEDFRKSSLEEQERIVTKFKALTTPEILKQRRNGFTDAAKAAMKESRFQTCNGSTSSTPSPGTSSSNGQDAFEHLDHLHDDKSEDERFRRELELAKHLSLAEQRGHERTISERPPGT